LEAATQRSDTYSLGNEEGIITVGSVPITSVENADGFIVECRERLEEADETALVIELEMLAAKSRKTRRCTYLEFWSGSHAAA
jgi:hypothetical protein